MESITCTTSNISKAVSEYGKSRGGKYYKHNCRDCLNAVGRKYYTKNNEKVKERARIYREQHRDKIYEIHNCPCGGLYCNNGKARHERTRKHIIYATIESALQKLKSDGCSKLVFDYINHDKPPKAVKDKIKQVKYWDYDEKEVKIIKLPYSVVEELHRIILNNHTNNFTALKLMGVI